MTHVSVHACHRTTETERTWPSSARGIAVAFLLIAAGSGLDAYNLGPVPIQWIVQFGAIIVGAAIVLRHGMIRIPGTGILLGFVLWALFVTLRNVMLHGDAYASMMPSGATSSYDVFVLLRIANLVAFFATLQVASWMLAQGGGRFIVHSVVFIAAALAVVAVYMYLAQTRGLPDLLGNRMGTSGEEQAVHFTYGFHRAKGTFREPSHLAEWLVLPMLLSLSSGRVAFRMSSLAIATALLLSGSLTGFVGLAAGLSAALAVRGLPRSTTLKLLGRLIVVLAIALVAFGALAVSYGHTSTQLGRVLSERITPILAEGIRESNRGYVYDYLGSVSVRPLGVGLGNANLLFGQYLAIDLVPSFLSLYVNALLSTGPVGLMLLLFLLVSPISWYLGRRYGPDNDIVIPSLAAGIAWLVMFAVRSEELTTMYAVVFALLAHLRSSRWKGWEL